MNSKSAGLRVASFLGELTPPEVFSRQSGIIEPAGIRLAMQNGSPVLQVSGGLRTYPIEDSAGRALGAVHGHMLDMGSGMFDLQAGRIILRAADVDLALLEEGVIPALRGVFVLETYGSLPPRLYADCSGMIPVVYCPRTRRAASSAAMMFDTGEYEARFLGDLHKRAIEQSRAPDPWLPGRLTAHEGLWRLQANHYLDLATWEAARYWPRPDSFTLKGNRADMANFMAGRLMETVQGIVNTYDRPMVTLTAGYDSRMILAATHAVARDLEFVTLQYGDRGMDQDIAAELCAELGLRHHIIPVEAASDVVAERWDQVVGHAVNHVNRRTHPALAGLQGDILITGLFGEVARSRFYQQDLERINETPLTVERLLARQNLPAEPEVVAEAETWLDGLSWAPPSVVLDLAYAERNYLNLWGMAQMAMIREIAPFSDGAMRRALIALPPSEKGVTDLCDAVIARLWPEVMARPINAYGDRRDLIRKLAKYTNPARILAALRRKLT